ncbi:hypothetical protein CBM2634_U300007 [Cupriavidus taiwanensis]|uniref:Transposase n=1 Tax=Cupriavidus taiwanensis TaxID=164546 RepID=A0A375JDZ7_9BURK|nr:hypothetical protein CBM2634_U300007 [Cupriavidus taiwanensis]
MNHLSSLNPLYLYSTPHEAISSRCFGGAVMTCVLLMKRLERGRFVWPRADGGVVSLSQAQLSMLLEGINWRQPVRTAEPISAL